MGRAALVFHGLSCCTQHSYYRKKHPQQKAPPTENVRASPDFRNDNPLAWSEIVLIPIQLWLIFHVSSFTFSFFILFIFSSINLLFFFFFSPLLPIFV